MRRRGPGPGRAGAVRHARRTRRRRRRWRRRIILGGAIVISGAHRHRKLRQQDAQRIEEHTGVPLEELEEEELDAAMSELGITEQTMTAEDEAAIDKAG